MPYKQSFEHNFSTTKSPEVLLQAEFDAKTEESLKIIEGLKKEGLSLFNFGELNYKISQVLDFVTDLKSRFEHLIVLGTGGSTLCGQCLSGMLYKNKPDVKLTFIDNIDPVTLDVISRNIDLKTTAILTISKSGGTLEVLSQLIFFLNLYSDTLGAGTISENFFAISDPENGKPNTLRKIAKQFNIRVLEHENVGGRFSIFTNVGLIPAAFIGLDISAVLNGAKQVVEDVFEKSKEHSKPVQGAIFNYLYEIHGYNITVMMPYIDRLIKFNLWYSQIWAESLGKNNYGLTPLRALGSLDQHSQLQQFLDGKSDKIFNFIVSRNRKQDIKHLDTSMLDQRELDFLNGKDFSKLINTSAESTITTLKNHKKPVRVFEIDELNEFTLGALCMHFIFETVIVAKMAGLDPFDQPAVEEGKQITLNILKNS